MPHGTRPNQPFSTSLMATSSSKGQSPAALSRKPSCIRLLAALQWWRPTKRIYPMRGANTGWSEPLLAVGSLWESSTTSARRSGTGSHCLKSEATFCCGSASNIRAKMDTTSSLLVQKTIVGEPERRDDYGLAKGGGKHLDQIPASRLATRLGLLRNTLRPTPHVQLAMK